MENLIKAKNLLYSLDNSFKDDLKAVQLDLLLKAIKDFLVNIEYYDRGQIDGLITAKIELEKYINQKSNGELYAID